MWYLANDALEDEETQKRGIIIIDYNLIVGINKKEWNTVLFRRSSRLVEALPWKVVAYHFCYDDQRLLAVVSWLQLLHKLPECRFRLHYGEFMSKASNKCHYRERKESTSCIPFHLSLTHLTHAYANQSQAPTRRFSMYCAHLEFLGVCYH